MKPAKARRTRGFSLLEVVIAIALFASGVAITISLLARTVGRSEESLESVTATNLLGRVESELKSAANNDLEEIRAKIASGNLRFIASRDGDVVSIDSLEQSDAFFSIEPSISSLNGPNSAGPLTVLFLFVKISWPYRMAGAAQPSAESDRNSITLPLVVAR